MSQVLERCSAKILDSSPLAGVYVLVSGFYREGGLERETCHRGL